MAATELPKHARVVIVGGGIIGCSVAYHLAQIGWKDVVLLERSRLTSGTTWHAAGLIATFGSLSSVSTELRIYTRDLYARLEAETGVATGFRSTGFIEIATDTDRLEEYKRVTAFNRLYGIDVHEISGREVGELFPQARTDDILAGFYVKEDGRANPVDVTMALAKGARMNGAKLIEGVSVTDVKIERGVAKGVQTDRGYICADYVVNCGGMWARELGARSGVNVPLQSAEHYYLITDTIEGMSADQPVLEDPGSYGYFREEVGGLMIGLFEPVCAPWKVEGVPADFSFAEIEPDWDRMGPYVQKAMERVPVAIDTGVKKFFCGPESFTADMAPIFGESPEVRNYFVAAGLNSIGIITGGGIGRLMAHWIVTGRPDMDITSMNIDRLQTYQSNPEYRRQRTVEALGMVYKAHYPTRTMSTARGAKKTALHDRLAGHNAYFKETAGWESPDWYAPPGVRPEVDKLSWGRMNWFPYWQAEHEAAREGVIVMDMSFMAKFIVEGRDAGRVLEQISAGEVSRETGMITYTQWLNEGGTLEADLTVTKLDEERYWVVASDTSHFHALAWLRRHIPDDAHAFATDVTSGYCQLNVQGPRSRELLQTITSADLSNDAFPFRTAREVDIGLARLLLVRITYLGELGYELYIPAHHATHVYDRVVEAGQAFGVVHAGLKSLGSLRMEKGYRDYGHDIDNTDSPLEAGLGFAVALDKPGGFIGRDAVLAKRAEGPLKRRLLQILIKDPEPLMYHAEVVHRDGKPVGYIRAASYGFTLGGAVGLSMIEADEAIDNKWIDAGKWEVDVAGTRYPAVASIRPLYDPKMERIKA